MSKYTVSDETMDNLRSTVRDIGSITCVDEATPDALIRALLNEREEMKEQVETQIDEILKLEDKLVTETMSQYRVTDEVMDRLRGTFPHLRPLAFGSQAAEAALGDLLNKLLNEREEMME